MVIVSRSLVRVVGLVNTNGTSLSTESDPSQSRAEERAFAEIMSSKVAVESWAPRSDRVSTRRFAPPDPPTNEDAGCAVFDATDVLEHENGDGT